MSVAYQEGCLLYSLTLLLTIVLVMRGADERSRGIMFANFQTFILRFLITKGGPGL